jgi:HD-like signal output (HDOD) protein
MLANANNESQQTRSDSRLGRPTFPAAPEAVAQLQLLASSHVVDLGAITAVIRGDAALTIQLLQFGAAKLGKLAGEAASVEELVVHLGLEQLRAMAADALLANHPTR